MKRRILVPLFFCLCSGLVLAHSELQRSEPGAESVLRKSPNELKIWFTEPIKVALSTFAVRDAAGKQIDQRDLRADPKEPTLVHLSLPPNLGAGVYQVSWSTVAQDLHVGRGGFNFRVSVSSEK